MKKPTIRSECLRFAKIHGISCASTNKNGIPVAHGNYATVLNDWAIVYRAFVLWRNGMMFHEACSYAEKEQSC